MRIIALQHVEDANQTLTCKSARFIAWIPYNKLDLVKKLPEACITEI